MYGAVCGALDERASWTSCAMRGACAKGGTLGRPLAYGDGGEWNEDNEFRELRRQSVDTEPNFLVTALFKILMYGSCVVPAALLCALDSLCCAEKKKATERPRRVLLRSGK